MHERLPFKHFLLFKAREDTHPADQSKLIDSHSIYDVTKQRMQSKLDVLATQLDALPDSDSPHMVIGSEDFFDSTLDVACFDMRAAYEVMANELKQLSKKYPNVLFSPGSFYISTPIPDAHHMCSMEQEGTKRNLKSTTCYVSNIMPIYYNGKLIRIIRKGEKIIEKIPKKKGVDLRPISSADELSDKRSQPVKLSVISYHEDELDSIIKVPTQALSGVCYLGKTYLPGEIELIKKTFGASVDPQALMNHEFELGGNTCLALICGEYIDESSTTRKLLANNQYDYVIHSTNGGNLGNVFEGHYRVYVHADQGQMSKITIDDGGEKTVPVCGEEQHPGIVIKKY